jgi:hypothetical protein
VHPASFLTLLDQPGVAQEQQVPGDSGRGKLEQFGELADAEFSAGQRRNDADAVFVRQGLGNGDEEAEAHSVYFAN